MSGSDNHLNNTAIINPDSKGNSTIKKDSVFVRALPEKKNDSISIKDELETLKKEIDKLKQDVDSLKIKIKH